jgi:hypothetical protein
MPRSVSGVMDAARDRHPAFDHQLMPPGPLARFIADYTLQMQGRLRAIDSTLSGFEVTLTFELPLADFDAGLALGAHRLVQEVTLVDPVGRVPRRTTPVTLIPRDLRFAPNVPTAAAWQEGNILYLRGPSSLWSPHYDQGTVEVQVIEGWGDVEGAALLAPGATLPLPDDAVPAVIEAAAAFMARRAPAALGINVREFAEQQQLAEARAIEATVQRVNGRSYVIQDVWQPGMR